MNLARNECLTDGADYDTGVAKCSDYPDQHWRHQSLAIVNAASGYCLEPGTNSPGARICTLPCRTTTRQGRTVTYW